MYELQQAIDAIKHFNDRAESILGKERNFSVDHLMILETSGLSIVIRFMGVGLWSSEDDERDFDSEKGEYEPLLGFLEKEAKKVLKQFYVVLHSEEEQQPISITNKLLGHDETF